MDIVRAFIVLYLINQMALMALVYIEGKKLVLSKREGSLSYEESLILSTGEDVHRSGKVLLIVEYYEFLFQYLGTRAIGESYR